MDKTKTTEFNCSRANKFMNNYFLYSIKTIFSTSNPDFIVNMHIIK